MWAKFQGHESFGGVVYFILVVTFSRDVFETIVVLVVVLDCDESG